MSKNNVDLILNPARATVSAATAPMEVIHVRPDHPDAHQCGCNDHPMVQMLRQAGLPIPEHMEADHANVPKHHPQGGVTIGFFVDPVNQIINVGFAKCNDEDFYNKKQGVKLVRERLEAADGRFTFSLSIENVLEFSIASMKELRGLKPAFVDTITFDHLSKDAVQYAIGQGVARRIKALHEEYHRNITQRAAAKAEKKLVAQSTKQFLEDIPAPDMPLH